MKAKTNLAISVLLLSSLAVSPLAACADDSHLAASSTREQSAVSHRLFRLRLRQKRWTEPRHG